ncbi:MAG: NlpC/P60 family protein [Acidimicrobiia bacterium]
MNLRTKVSVVILVTATTAATAFPALSGASPVDDKRRQAAELQHQIDANDNQIVMLSEQLNGARIRHDQAQAGIDEAKRRTDIAEGQRRHLRSMLSQRAAQMYKGAGSASPLAQMDVKSLGEISTRAHYAAAAADRDNTLVARLQKAEEALAVRRADLERQRASAEAETAAASAAKSKIDAANKQAAALKQQVNGEIATILQREAAARAAAAQREAQRRAAAPPARAAPPGGGRGAPIPANFPDVPAPNGGAAAAVAFAKAQVGKRYVYATSGPDTYDCSGLTGAAWERGGVSLTHYSGAQYQQTMRIGAGDLQPGDLIFYGPGGSNHVEIYIGNGGVVSASNPSTGVKFSSVRYGSATGYGRVRA